MTSEPDFEVAGEAGDGDEAIILAAQLQPDVVLMDLHMPGIGGIEATRRILNTSPHISVLVVSMFEDDDSVFAAMQAGDRGNLLKGALKAEILRGDASRRRWEAIFGSRYRKTHYPVLHRTPRRTSAYPTSLGASNHPGVWPYFVSAHKAG